MTPNAIRRVLVSLALVSLLGAAGCTATPEDITALASNSGSFDDTANGGKGGGDGKATGRAVVGKPYRAGGRWFTPKEDPEFDQLGHASWYGAELHGNRTANGERFDAEAMTAAHPTLPLPSYVRVTNTANGKAAVLRLNDRGPFSRDRLIDVSRGAAEKLGFRQSGSAEVRVEYLGPAELGGTDRETLVAEAKFGTAADGSAPSEARGFRDMIPFGIAKRKERAPEGNVEVRLASVMPGQSRPAGNALPGVYIPGAYAELPVTSLAAQDAAAGTTPATAAVATVAVGGRSAAELAQAYQEQDTATMDALMAMSAPTEAEVVEFAPVTASAPVAVVAAPLAPMPLPSGEPLRDAPGRAAPPAPLAVAPAPASEQRIMGAHDLFAAIDVEAGGSGELNGVSR